MTVIETAALPARRLEWELAETREIRVETYRVKSLLLHIPDWSGHLPGQHVDIRLTAEDGSRTRIACCGRGARLYRSEIVQSRIHRGYACRSRLERARYGASRDRESGSPEHQGCSYPDYGRRPTGARRVIEPIAVSMC
jgi:hypothetical protein